MPTKAALEKTYEEVLGKIHDLTKGSGIKPDPIKEKVRLTMDQLREDLTNDYLFHFPSVQTLIRVRFMADGFDLDDLTIMNETDHLLDAHRFYHGFIGKDPWELEVEVRYVGRSGDKPDPAKNMKGIEIRYWKHDPDEI